MQYVLKTKQDELLWLDAVIGIGEQYVGSLTNHPIESGATITDHFILSNDTLSLTAVVSNYDFLIGRNTVGDLTGVIVTSSQEATPVVVNYNSPGVLSKVVPEAISNLVSPSLPEAVFATRGEVSNEETIKAFLKILQKRAEIVSILGFDETKGFVLVEDYTDFVITNLSFSRSPDDIDALVFSCSFEKPKFVSTQRAAVPTTVTKGLENQMKNKGNAGSGDTQSLSTDGAIQDAGFFNKPNSTLKRAKDSLSDAMTATRDFITRS